jgi:hypothetical protein
VGQITRDTEAHGLDERHGRLEERARLEPIVRDVTSIPSETRAVT